MITIEGNRILWDGGVLKHPVDNDDAGLTNPIVVEGRMPTPSEWFAILAELFAMPNHAYTQGFVEVLALSEVPSNPAFPSVGTKGIALIYSDGIAVMYNGSRFWWLVPNQWKLLPNS
jgi:hypothetical protein